jgi:ubiquitin-conjugating enzyme E2 J1
MIAIKLRRLGTHSGPVVAIIGLQGFFPLKGQAAVGVGALEVPTSERKRLAGL